MIPEEKLDALEAAAKSWVGTPFCEGLPIKGIGVSCHHFCAELFFEAGLVERLPIPSGPSHYSPANSRSLIEEWVKECGLFIVGKGPVQAGDFLGFRVVNAIHHAAVALRHGRIVHSVLGKGVLIASNIPGAWEVRLERIWRLKRFL